MDWWWTKLFSCSENYCALTGQRYGTNTNITKLAAQFVILCYFEDFPVGHHPVEIIIYIFNYNNINNIAEVLSNRISGILNSTQVSMSLIIGQSRDGVGNIRRKYGWFEISYKWESSSCYMCVCVAVVIV